MGHTKVKLTWDQDDPKRFKTVKRRFNEQQIEEQDLRDYLASSGGEESDDPEEVARKRALLGLGGESESDGEIDNAIGVHKSKSKKAAQQITGDIKITFSDFSHSKVDSNTISTGYEEIGKKLIESKKEKEELNQLSAFEKYQRERKQKRREKKMKEKEKKELDKGMMYEKPDEPTKPKHKKIKLEDIVSKNAATKEELDLLTASHIEAEEFKPDPKDNRFKAIYEKGVFSIDPTHSKANKNVNTFMKEGHKRKFKKH